MKTHFSFLKLISSAAVVATILASHALAETATSNRLSGAWKSALAGEEPVLTPKQFAQLNNLAYQAATARVCDGFELDQTKFTTALGEAAAPSKSDLTDDDKRRHEAFVLIEFGMRYGLLIAEGDAQKQSFCANAAELKGNKDVPNVWE